MKCDCDAFSDAPCPSHGYGTMECECGAAVRAPLVVRGGWDLMCSCRRRYIGVEDAAHGYWKPLQAPSQLIEAPLTMSREDEARFRTHATVVPDMAALIAEIDALRRLPVIATCGECRWCHPSEVCTHERAHIEQEIDGSDRTPPEWCPLRGGAK